MAEYLAPGVYVEEVASGARPIEGVATSTAGFVGMAERGPAEVMRVDGAEELERCYGGPSPGVSHLHDAVLGFFANGGRTAYVARVPEPGAAALIAGIDRMADADGVALLVVPDEAVAGPEVAAAMVARCERRRDRIAVLSTPRDPGPDGPPPPPDSPFAAAYHPWITVTDPGAGRARCRRPATSRGSSPGPTWSGASTPRPPARRCSTPSGSWPGCRPATRRSSPRAASTRSSRAGCRSSGARGRPRSTRSGST